MLFFFIGINKQANMRWYLQYVFEKRTNMIVCLNNNQKPYVHIVHV